MPNSRRPLLGTALLLTCWPVWGQIPGRATPVQPDDLHLRIFEHKRRTSLRFVGFDDIRPDMGWGELNEQERQQLRTLQATHLPPGGDPAYPLTGFGRLRARLGTIEEPPHGELTLRIAVDRTGTVRSVTVTGAGDVPRVAQHDIEKMVEQAGFRAARCDGQPCAGKFEVRLVYRD